MNLFFKGNSLNNIYNKQLLVNIIKNSSIKPYKEVCVRLI